MKLSSIDPKDLMVGDIVMVQILDGSLHTDATIVDVDSVGGRVYFVDNENPSNVVRDYIEDIVGWLVHRPKKLPTKLGSVVKVGDRTFVLAGNGFRSWWEITSGIWHSSGTIENMTEGWELVE